MSDPHVKRQMQEFAIRDEIDSDHSTVREIHEVAFSQPNEGKLVESLRVAAFPQISLVAEVAGELVGHIFLSPVRIEECPSKCGYAGLAPVGVKPSAQDRGIGSALIREALARCADVEWFTVFVLGDPTYYARFGFVLAAPLGLRYESEQFDSHFQVLELKPGVLSGARGWVRYHEVFSDL